MSGSTDKIKLYSREECAAINGIWHANGECTKKEGGSYSWDNRTQATRIKLYSKDECDALGGNWYPNGECLKKTGGSYSWDNRPLEKTAPQAIYTVRVTLPDATHEYKTVSAVKVTDQAGNVLLNLPETVETVATVTAVTGLDSLKDK